MPKFVALVPVKPPAQGKSRLVGVRADDRRRLAEAFALDTVAACVGADRVEQVLVATDDAAFSTRLDALGAVSIPDGVALDLNETLRQSAAEARRRWPDLLPVALCADLPAVRPEDLDAGLGQAAPVLAAGGSAYVVDAAGVGTSMYAATHDGFDPQFGFRSAAVHRSAGATPVAAQVTRLRRDVDDLDDLRDALALGVGPATRDVARGLADGLVDGPAGATG